MKKLIHKAKCMECYRIDEGILTTVFHEDDEPRYQQVHKAIHNAAEKLRIMEDSGFSPKLLEEKDTFIIMEDLGERNVSVVSDFDADGWKDFIRELVKCLIKLRLKNLRHADLNGNNIFIRDKKPYFVDWWETHYINEKPPGSSPLTDAYWLFTDIIKWIDNPVLSDPNRLCRRWGPIHGALVGSFNNTLPQRGKTLLDVGCFQGDFSAWAAAEMMIVTGIDTGQFRSGEDSMEIAKSLWKGIPNLKFKQANVMDWKNFKYDVILFMDTFSHLVKYLGKEAPTKLLNRMVDEAGCVFFETQMDGDRTGVEWLKTPEDIFALVPGAQFKEIVTLPEHGIPRTLWKITKGVK